MIGFMSDIETKLAIAQNNKHSSKVNDFSFESLDIQSLLNSEIKV